MSVMRRRERGRRAPAMAALAVLLAFSAAAADPPRGEAPGGEARPLPGSSLLATFRIEPWLRRELAGGSYAQELARAYQERADEEAGYSGRGDKNWLDATAFFAKAERAASGEEVVPWSPGALGLSDPLLLGAHRAVIRRSLRYRAPAPAACAQMVALYDHWIEQIREAVGHASGPASAPPPGAAQGPGAAVTPAQARLFPRFAEAFSACSAPVKILGFPIGGCSATDEDGRLPDAPAPGLGGLGQAELLAEEIAAEEASGLLELMGARILLKGSASATGARGPGAADLPLCRARFVRRLLVAAGVSADRIRILEGRGAGGAGAAPSAAGEAYAARGVTLSLQ